MTVTCDGLVGEFRNKSSSDLHCCAEESDGEVFSVSCDRLYFLKRLDALRLGGALILFALGLEAALAGLPDSLLMQIASEINKDMPMMVSATARLNNVAGMNNKLIYNYSILDQTGPAIVASRFIQLQRANIVASACSNPKTRLFLDKGVSLEYMYSGSDGQFAGNILVAPGNCASR